MDKTKARQIVLDELNSTYKSPGDRLVVLDYLTIEKPYGWVFFFNSERYLDTQNVIYALGGNGPVVFETATSTITRLGSALPPEEEIRTFEQQRGLR
ncbi:MAG TPA: hypothetical protein ENJ16_06110 [Planctomycetaceae bacterium]|nr:hypothetical protein [Planctomycetaceae bacterium]